MTLAELRERWRADATVLRRRGADGAAQLLEGCAAELDAVDEASRAAAIVTPAQAARLTGYSAEHIARLVRRGTIPNVGRKHAPRVRLADVPRKAGTLADASAAPHLVGATRRDLTRAVAND